MTRRLRVEIIRFGLLLVMTVALVSVATRHNDHGSDRNEAARSHQPSATATPSSGGTSASSSSAPAVTQSPAGSSSPGPATGSPAGTGNGPAGTGGSAGASGASGSGEVGSAPTLPRTGGTQTVDLAALAALFIAAGSFGMRISRPRTVQAGEPAAIALMQPGHAPDSSGSNRPGTV